MLGNQASREPLILISTILMVFVCGCKPRGQESSIQSDRDAIEVERYQQPFKMGVTHTVTGDGFTTSMYNERTYWLNWFLGDSRLPEDFPVEADLLNDPAAKRGLGCWSLEQVLTSEQNPSLKSIYVDILIEEDRSPSCNPWKFLPPEIKAERAKPFRATLTYKLDSFHAPNLVRNFLILAKAGLYSSSAPTPNSKELCHSPLPKRMIEGIALKSGDALTFPLATVPQMGMLDNTHLYFGNVKDDFYRMPDENRYWRTVEGKTCRTPVRAGDLVYFANQRFQDSVGTGEIRASILGIAGDKSFATHPALIGRLQRQQFGGPSAQKRIQTLRDAFDRRCLNIGKIIIRENTAETRRIFAPDSPRSQLQPLSDIDHSALGTAGAGEECVDPAAEAPF